MTKVTFELFRLIMNGEIVNLALLFGYCEKSIEVIMALKPKHLMILLTVAIAVSAMG